MARNHRYDNRITVYLEDEQFALLELAVRSDKTYADRSDYVRKAIANALTVQGIRPQQAANVAAAPAIAYPQRQPAITPTPAWPAPAPAPAPAWPDPPKAPGATPTPAWPANMADMKAQYLAAEAAAKAARPPSEDGAEEL